MGDREDLSRKDDERMDKFENRLTKVEDKLDQIHGALFDDNGRKGIFSQVSQINANIVSLQASVVVKYEGLEKSITELEKKNLEFATTKQVIVWMVSVVISLFGVSGTILAALKYVFGVI